MTASTTSARTMYDRYVRAESMQKPNVAKAVTSAGVVPNWIGDTDTFWYVTTTAAGKAFVLVDAVARTKAPAFDHERMADALGTVLDERPDATALPFGAIALEDGCVEFAVDLQAYHVSLDDYAITAKGTVELTEARSPDGRWAVLVRDHDLVIRDTETGAERQLTTDGAEAHAYAGMNDSCAGLVMQQNIGRQIAPPVVVWSPDSTRFITHRLDQRDTGLMHLVRSSPTGGGRPELLSYRYALPGDEFVPTAQYHVFEAATGESVQAKCDPIPMPFVPGIAYGWVWWSEDSSTPYWISSSRGDLDLTLSSMDPTNGDVTVHVEVSAPTHINLGPQQQDCNVRTLRTGEVLWWAQRSGWGHLYLYGTDGSVTPVTSGDWMVRHVVLVDEDARRVVFTAGWRDPDADPYLQQLCSVSLDGGEVTAITSDGMDHHCTGSPVGGAGATSPTRRFFVDVTSRWDTPGVSVLRDAAGEIVMELEAADASELYAAGWTAPERVKVKAADGVTDIWCAIYRPFDFDPSRSYPVIDETYPGPQISSCPLRFPGSGGPITGERSGAEFAALGFVVVVVDGRGGALREKAFQDEARVPHAIFVDDHVAAIEQLAETRPWMDLDRVGIVGESAGASGATRAMLQRPDVFKVAVAGCGNHDNRVNHAWWGEKFFGLADAFDFTEGSNCSLAANLEGKLLLMHGEMDDNAVPHGTMRLVDALIRANKDVDLVIMPNADHGGLCRTGYFIRRRWDYVVQHLMGETPPKYEAQDIVMQHAGLR
jgi:dipeptidyl-peptidase 4